MEAESGHFEFFCFQFRLFVLHVKECKILKRQPEIVTQQNEISTRKVEIFIPLIFGAFVLFALSYFSLFRVFVSICHLFALFSKQDKK